MVAGKKTSELPDAATVDGKELLDVVQGGTNVKASLDAVRGINPAALIAQVYDLQSGQRALDARLTIKEQALANARTDIADIQARDDSIANTAVTLGNRITALEGGSPPAVPNAPTGLHTTSVGDSSVHLAWTASTAGAPTSYQVQSRTVSGAWVNAGSPVSVTNANVTGLAPPGATYQFQVYGRNGAGPGPASASISVTLTNTGYTPSPDDTYIPNVSSLTMDDGGVVTLEGGIVMLTPRGGAKGQMGYSSYVDIVYMKSRRIYQHSTSPSLPPEGGWWYWDTIAGTWVGTGDPRGVLPTTTLAPTTTPRPTTTPTPTTTNAPSGSIKQNLINFMHQVGAAGKMISAQTSFPGLEAWSSASSFFGFDLGMMVSDPYMHQWTNDYTYETQFLQPMINHWNAGGLAGCSFLCPAPTEDGSRHSYGDGIYIDPNRLINPSTGTGSHYKSLMDAYATDVLIPLKNAGVPVIFRPFFEFDGGWFWWGYTSWSPAEFVAAYRYTWNYLVNTRGCNHMLWMYAANGGPGPNSLISDCYPGDSYVDGIGIDVYSNDPEGGGYPEIFALIESVAPSKFVSFTEWGASQPGDTSFDARRLINGVKNRTWGAVTYINAWMNYNWEWKDIANARAALADPIVLNRNNMNRGF